MADIRNAIKHIHINFDLRPLIKELEADKDFFLKTRRGGKEMLPSLYKGVAKGARKRILKGNLRKLKPNTVKIRKKAGQMPPNPLLRTGKLYKSIEARKQGVFVESYGIDHLEGYTIKAGSNEFTKNWKRDVYVKPRNYLPTSETITLSKKDSAHIYKKINKIIRKKGR
tara:strand:+ start:13 stop:519 length:507 start_codon:yes stop_codon:yes gene_type:complete